MPPDDPLGSAAGSEQRGGATFAGAPSTVAERLIGPELVDAVPGGLQVKAVSPAANYRAYAADDGDDLQVVGATDRAGSVLRFSFRHSWGCGPEETPLFPTDSEGIVSLAANNGEGAPPITVGVPWALDSTGASVHTWYEIEGETLVQVIDATWAEPPVFFDPTYTSFSCPGYWSTLSAGLYLDLNISDSPACPTRAMFTAANNYFPVWGYETNVANDVGNVSRSSSGWRVFGAGHRNGSLLGFPSTMQGTRLLLRPSKGVLLQHCHGRGM